MEKTGFFEEAPRVKSMSRLQMFWGTIFAFGFIAFQALTTKEGIDLSLAVILLTFAAAPKVISKFAEKVPMIGK